MRLVVGGDHAGFPLKGPVVDTLRSWGHEVADVGTDSPDPVDFPDIAELVCEAVRKGDAERGIMVCGTGVGASIAANKFRGIRAALCHDVYSAHQYGIRLYTSEHERKTRCGGSGVRAVRESVP